MDKIMIVLYWTKPWNWHNELQKLTKIIIWYCSSFGASLQMYYPDGVIDIRLDVLINHIMFLAGSTSKFMHWNAVILLSFFNYAVITFHWSK